MALYKPMHPFFPDGNPNIHYYGCQWESVDGVIMIKVPDEFVKDYIEAGRIMGEVPKQAEPEPPKVEVPDPVVAASEKTESAEDVVAGTTEEAVVKKTARKAKSTGK